MILVTGASGTVGSEVLRQLQQAGAPTRAGFNNPQKVAQAKTQGQEAIRLDYGDRASVAAAVQGVEKVFLLGANSPTQVEDESRVAEEAKKAGVKQLVKLSVLDADKEGYIFARWHRAVEKNIDALGLDRTFVRANGFMQNFVTYYGATIRGQNAFYLPNRDARISHIDVRDLAAVIVAALTKPGHAGKAYEVTGPEALSGDDVATKLSAALGRKINYVDIPMDAFRQGALGAGMPAFIVDGLADLQRYYVEGKAAHISPDVEKVTGRKPGTFEQFARDYAGTLKSSAA
jgi:uncharacterized protein YbjT (DUF2867 family)